MTTAAFVNHISDARLVILDVPGVRVLELTGKSRWSLGRGVPGNTPDIVMQSPLVGRSHGSFVCLEGRWYYSYANSTNATFINGELLRPHEQPVPYALRNGDVLRIDYGNLMTPDLRGVLLMFTTDSLEGRWHHTILNPYEELIIGRDPAVCAITEPYPYISARNTRIFFKANGWFAEDLHSTPGTWLNGRRLETAMPLKEKDKISICNCHYIFTGNGLLYCSRHPGGGDGSGYILKADIASKVVPDSGGRGMKELLHDVQVQVRQGTLVALLGGSGAGKTTLMNCLNGFDPSGVTGRVLFDGEDLYSNFERLKYTIGSVPQSNVIHDDLQVFEELRTAAILRLPKDTSAKEIRSRVENTLQLLNLTAVSKSRNRKLSGGEKKRVNIGVELVADRRLLCLDEPDAGLDPESKRELFTILRRLAHKEGKSILVIIHDVSDIDMFDQVIMMAKVNNVGRLAFSGAPRKALEFFQVESLKDAYSRIAENPDRYIQKAGV